MRSNPQIITTIKSSESHIITTAQALKAKLFLQLGLVRP